MVWVFWILPSYPLFASFRIADPEWFDAQPWPYLHRWLQEFLGSAAFLRVMLKYPPWQEGAKAIRFPYDFDRISLLSINCDIKLEAV